MGNNEVENGAIENINKAAIKNFAVYSRNKLIKDIKNKAALIGITESGIKEPLSSAGNIQLFDIGTQEPYRIEGKAIEQRNALIRELKSREKDSAYETIYKALIEEVAYTWFNRIIAIRFMEVNNYMPDRMRVLSSGVERINEPEFITHVFETSFEFSEEEKHHIIELKTDGSNLAMDELFQYLFIKQCNALNDSLPELFEKTNDHTELLLTVSYNDVEGVIYKLVHDVPETDFDVNSENGNGQVEIIGWMYQYYNTEPKSAVDKDVKAKKKVSKFQLPAKTQLFTPDWIVKYMVENSLGRIWIEKLLINGDSRTEKEIAEEFRWKYYLPEPKQEEAVEAYLREERKDRKNLSIEDIKFLDPAMGSFHIGVYAFEVFMQLYESEGYTKREATQLILEKNLYGIEIDKRAAQLSYFACLMQARKYNRQIFNNKIHPQVYEIPESNLINKNHINYLGKNVEDKRDWNNQKEKLMSLVDDFKDAKEYGSLLKLNNKFNFNQLRMFVISNPVDIQISLLDSVGLEESQKELLNLINVAEILSNKYEIVITNPPYMGSNAMNKKLINYAQNYYPDSKSDMFAMFIEKCNDFSQENGFFALITQHTWMLILSYENLRKKIINQNTILNLLHFGRGVFGSDFGTVAFVVTKKDFNNYKALYRKLHTKPGNVDSLNQKEKWFYSNFGYYEFMKELYFTIPTNPIAYWLSNNVVSLFENCEKLGEYADPRQGLATGNDENFLRSWYEIDFSKIGFGFSSVEDVWQEDVRYVPFNKGGAYRKWYGNNNLVIKFDKKSYQELAKSGNRLPSRKYYFRKGTTWSSATASSFSGRYCETGFVFAGKGPMCFANDERDILSILAFLNSKLTSFFMDIFSSATDFNQGTMRNLPYIPLKGEIKQKIGLLVSDCIDISKNDWDESEISWDFERHPFIKNVSSNNKSNLSLKISDIYTQWETKKNQILDRLKINEETINRILIDLYNLQEELTPEVEEKDMSLQIPHLQRDIKSFMSYFMGCVFGRYNFHRVKVIPTGKELVFSKDSLFHIDRDNVIPITEDNYFSEDIITLFDEFLVACYGKETLEENLDFIAQALGKKEESSRGTIRNYFVVDFYKDHLKTYQKKPIYWLYDSGKQNGFKALVYMHRYDEDTTGRVRVDYLHQVQKAYERATANLQDDIVNSKDAKEITQLQKRIEKITKQLKECKDYDERLGHIALERISIDLDDGVKVNYQKIQTDSKGKFYQILAEI